MEWGRTRLARSAAVPIAALLLLAGSSTATAQDTATPSPTIPPPVIPPLPPPPAGGSAAGDSVAERLRKLEETNQKLMDRLEKLSDENEKLSKEVKDLSGKVKSDSDGQDSDSGEASGGGPGADTTEKKPKDSGLSGQDGWEKVPAARAAAMEERQPAGGARGSGARLLPRAQGEGNRYLGRIPLKTFFDYGRDGVGWATEDDEFLLKFRTEFQTQYLGYLGPVGDPVKSGFYIPRIRYYFQGHFTKPIDYQLSFQESYGNFAVLNTFVNFDYTDGRFQLRAGRFKAPFTYEWYKINNWRLITPERSLFAENFGLNRMIGVMGWGQLFEERMEYAAAIMDGPRNSSSDYNTPKDVIGFLNFRPWQTRKDSPLRNFNIGGSVDYGMQDNPLTPAVLRTNVNGSSQNITSTAATNVAAVPFLAFNSNVAERGNRELWELHTAYYYNGLSLYAAWNGGFDSYAFTNLRPVALPVGGWNIAIAYLLTGETVNERTVPDPIRRFDLREGKFGLGAFEPFVRYSQLDVGRQVFTAGLADPNLWTNHASLFDVGVNWYLNRAIRVIFDWEHATFGNPVFYGPAGFKSSNDLLWLRFQIYF